MVTTRRSNGVTSPSSASSSSSATTKTPKGVESVPAVPAPTHSPLLPTRTERILLLAYPLTLLIGSLFSHISPSLRAPTNSSTYSTLHQSFQPDTAAPSYFAQKRNIFNVYFVKLGWFWCTVAFFGYLILVSRGKGAQQRRGKAGEKDAPTTRAVQWSKEAGIRWRQERDANDARIRRVYQAIARYMCATVLWVLTTQWFFGPALVDRGFKLTGGACQLAEEELQQAAENRKLEVGSLLTSAACKVAGGRWSGGYDISGHVFILILGSGMLWLEMLPFLFPDLKGVGVGRVVREWSGRDERVANELDAAGAELYRTPSLDVNRHQEPVKWTLRTYAMFAALSIATLSWWMLLMTAAFFHEWVEKLTACGLAFFGLWLVYCLPRGVPTMRAVVGMPGV